MRKGRLTLVGTGHMIAGQVTQEALACMEQSDKLFYVVADPATSTWIQGLNPTAESLHDEYKVGLDRMITYRRMVERTLVPVRAGKTVCLAFYGHPGVLVYPGHEAVRQ
ncbi:MAG TPA: SAM-dependent methyltransferase, partial [Thermoanaerobaculia bacterium]|nr:SAM-dependent methyltransferase [Thermoanaerobaculia bacterium]